MGQLHLPPLPHAAAHASKPQSKGICHQNKWPGIPAGSKNWEQMVFSLNNCFQQQFPFQSGFIIIIILLCLFTNQFETHKYFQCTDNKYLYLRESTALRLPTPVNHHLPGLEGSEKQKLQCEIPRGEALTKGHMQIRGRAKMRIQVFCP